ncbi:tetratricopeptide repeat protein [Pseudoalteromonas sp.]|uniref:tetratricopeptide repeat protein n=1 Tax=Pseudoalteromonas sp. TaxID=53249 RepID=UPI0023547601|nr:tetratricopeptide repeat protein [Pseudoalteromonas sp.]
MSQTNYSRYKYTPDEIDETEFLAKFVVRNHDFDDIFDDIKNSDYKVPSQHFIIVGQRGQGKTTLLRKIKLAVQVEPTLADFLIPIKFSEEQYQIRSLSRLWEEIADYLQCTAEDDFATIHDDMESHFDDADYELKSFSYLEKAVKAKNKKLLLLIDNIDELLGKLKDKEQRRLREILLTSPTLKIIGGSTKMLEQHFDYGKPFYEFFKIIKLIGLNKQECFDFLASMGDEQQKKKIAGIIKNTPERIETLRRLTGGVPRTMVMLFDIFVDDGGNAFDDLLKILDDATPLYKHRMDDLPETLQDITHTIAMNWDGISTKEIAKKTRLESKTVSAQLKQLETKYGIVESISIGKNKIYKIEERFFNIWYLMRFGRKKDRQKVEWLVNFLTSWCSPADLERRAKGFMNAIRDGKIHESYVYHMCEALSYAGLDINTEHEMKESTKAYLTSKNSSFINDLSASDKEIIKKARQLADENKIDEAIKLLIKSQKNSAEILFFTGYFYANNGNFNEAERYYLQSLERGASHAIFGLALLYHKEKRLNNAEKYYLIAAKSNDINALFNLGLLYKQQGRFEKSESYLIKASELGENEAYLILGELYRENDSFDKAITSYLKAFEKGHSTALLSLGCIYQEQGQLDQAVDCFLKAVENGNTDALFNLGLFYREQGKLNKARDYFLKAAEHGDNDALLNLGNTSREQGNLDDAESYYLQAAENGVVDALFNLGSFYLMQNKLDKAEIYYIKAAESGDHDALLNLGGLYQKQRKLDKAKASFIKAVDAGVVDAINQLAWLYFELCSNLKEALSLAKIGYERKPDYYSAHTLTTILLWGENLPQSHEVFLKWLDMDGEHSDYDITLYLTLLIAKKQLYKTKELLELPNYALKDKCKPVWYALMTLMQNDFPHELTKMGGELQESVDEVLQQVAEFDEKYALS